MNQVCLLGRLIKNPELRFAAGSGMGIARFTVAVNRRMKDKKTGKYEADFINCLSFGKQAETIAQYFEKGSQIAIVGHIQTGSYDAQDGSKRYTTDVVVDSFGFVGEARGAGHNNNTNNNNSNNDFVADMTPVDDGELPF